MKSSFDDLALFGGRPAFVAPLHVGRPNIGNQDRLFERLRGIIERRWLTNDGPLIHEFEDRIATMLGVRNCVVMANCTLALELTARAMGLAGEVVVPAFTFAATAHALAWAGLTPVFCDIDASTHNLDTEQAASLISPRTSAIVGVHVWGRGCDTVALEKLARRHGLALVYDAAHALGCTHRGRPIGTFGDAEVLSFHATKVANSFEGGAVVTDDDDLAERLRLMRSFGFANVDSVVGTGTNAKLTEVAAAMGLTSLDSLSMFIEANRRNHDLYHDHLSGLPGVSLIPHDPDETSNHHYVVLEIDTEAASISRDLILEALVAEGVLARRYFYPGCHRIEPYRSAGAGALPLPETDRLAGRVLQLPTGTTIGEAEVTAICDLFQLLIENAPDVSRRHAMRNMKR